AGDDVSSRPPGAPADADYLRGLPVAADDERPGTPVAGLGRAVEEFSGESLAAVPATGDWTAARLTALLDAVTAVTADGPVGVLAALWTGELVAAATPVADLDAGVRPGPDWSVAHVVALWGSRDGPFGPLLAVADTYPQLGSPDLGPGLHLQPTDRVAVALGHGGGLVLVGPDRRRDALTAALGRRPVGVVEATDLPESCQSAPSGTLRAVDRAERDAIVAALRDTDGNRAAAAAALGVARSTLYRKIAQYRITD
ncbi:helix-turn-helix domain-containing protein, partial [Pseudonocardia sp. McavD-2-B]|uniref:helix-turn-helix domain-containing protein n=1 Tax=Pseudonocardia sp. McavD-2-B TaxID=2954499 RepID=UPI0020977D67